MVVDDNTLVRMYGVPRVFITDTKGNPIYDSNSGPFSLRSFDYSFSEEDSDECTIILALTQVAHFNWTNLAPYQSIYVSWGYIKFMRPPIKLLIKKVKHSYKSSGLQLTITGTDNFSIFNEEKSPLLVKAEKLKEYLKNLNDAGLVVEAIKAYKDNKFGFYYPATGKYYEVDNIVSPYTLEINVPTGYTPGYPVRKPSSSVTMQRISDNFGKNSSTPQEEFEAFKQDLDNKSKDKKAAYQEYKESALAGKEVDPLSVAFWDFWGIDKDAIIEGNNPKSILSNALSQSEEDWAVTGHGNKVVIHTRNLTHSAYRSYEWGKDDGFLLEFDFDSDSMFNNDLLTEKFGIDPETGALTLKDYVIKKRNDTRDARTPLQYDKLSREAQAAEYLMDEPNPFSVYDSKGVIQGGVITLPPIGTQTPGEDLTSPNLMDRPINLAIDNTAVQLPVSMLVSPVASDLQDSMDALVKDLKDSQESKRRKVTALIVGDPLLGCSVNISITGVAKKHCGDYHIVNCNHSISSSGYTTSLTMYPISTFNSGLVSADAKVEKKEVVDSLKKYELGGAEDIPILGDSSKLVNKLPLSVYRVIYQDDKGKIVVKKVRMTSGEASNTGKTPLNTWVKIFPDATTVPILMSNKK